MMRRVLASVAAPVKVFRSPQLSSATKFDRVAVAAASSPPFPFGDQKLFQRTLSKPVFPSATRRWFSTVPQPNPAVKAPAVAAESQVSPQQLSLVYDADTRHYKLSVPLPSTGGKETCLFVVKPEQTVKSFLTELQHEDPSFKSALVYSGGSRVAQSTYLQDVLKGGFLLTVANGNYAVSAAGEQQQSKGRTEQLLQEFRQLYVQKRELDNRAIRLSNGVIWGGLGFLVCQWAFLARLTWWDLNWDIMEPVTYFITFGTAIAGYAYFAVAKREYTFADLRESVAARQMFKQYQKKGFPLDKYFMLEHELKKVDPHLIEEVEYELETAETGAATAKS